MTALARVRFSPATRMRGCAMPNWRRSASCRMRSVVVSDSRVIAAGTSASARWVVASATRSQGAVSPSAVRPASIMTTRGVAVVSARYSV